MTSTSLPSASRIDVIADLMFRSSSLAGIMTESESMPTSPETNCDRVGNKLNIPKREPVHASMKSIDTQSLPCAEINDLRQRRNAFTRDDVTDHGSPGKLLGDNFDRLAGIN